MTKEEKKITEPEAKEKKITAQDIQLLEAVFAMARTQIASDEQQLIAMIHFKKQLFDKLK